MGVFEIMVIIAAVAMIAGAIGFVIWYIRN